MKKIIALILFVSLGCSNSEDNPTSLLTNKIVGEWQLVGYYDDQEDPETGFNYHTVENGFEATFRLNNTFEKIYNETEVNSGTYNIAIDSTLTMNFTNTTSGESYSDIFKIVILNDSVLEYVAPGALFGPQLRLEKINNP